MAIDTNIDFDFVDTEYSEKSSVSNNCSYYTVRSDRTHSIEMYKSMSNILVYKIPYEVIKNKTMELKIENRFIVYILYGENNSGKPVIYVGKSKNGVSNRPQSHEDKYSNWSVCYILTSQELRSFFNDGTIHYIEDKVKMKVTETNRFINTTEKTTKGTANRRDMFNCDEYLREVYDMLYILGLDLITVDSLFDTNVSFKKDSLYDETLTSIMNYNQDFVSIKKQKDNISYHLIYFNKKIVCKLVQYDTDIRVYFTIDNNEYFIPINENVNVLENKTKFNIELVLNNEVDFDSLYHLIDTVVLIIRGKTIDLDSLLLSKNNKQSSVSDSTVGCLSEYLVEATTNDSIEAKSGKLKTIEQGSILKVPDKIKSVYNMVISYLYNFQPNFVFVERSTFVIVYYKDSKLCIITPRSDKIKFNFYIQESDIDDRFMGRIKFTLFDGRNTAEINVKSMVDLPLLDYCLQVTARLENFIQHSGIADGKPKFVSNVLFDRSGSKFESVPEHKRMAIRDGVKELYDFVVTYIMELSSSIMKVEKQVSTNFYYDKINVCCIIAQSTRLKMYFDIKYSDVPESLLTDSIKDVVGIGHNGTGDVMLTVETMTDLPVLNDLLKISISKNCGVVL